MSRRCKSASRNPSSRRGGGLCQIPAGSPPISGQISLTVSFGDVTRIRDVLLRVAGEPHLKNAPPSPIHKPASIDARAVRLRRRGTSWSQIRRRDHRLKLRDVAVQIHALHQQRMERRDGIHPAVERLVSLPLRVDPLPIWSPVLVSRASQRSASGNNRAVDPSENGNIPAQVPRSSSGCEPTFSPHPQRSKTAAIAFCCKAPCAAKSVFDHPAFKPFTP